MQLHVVDHDRGLAPVVDDPVVADDLRHPAAIQIHIHEQLGLDWICAIYRRISCREDRDSGLRADGSGRSDIDLAAARKKHARSLARAAGHPAVHPDGLLEVAVGSHCGDALRFSLGVDDTDPDAVRARPAGLDPAPDGDIYGPGGLGPVMVGDDAVGVIARGGDGIPVPSVDSDVAGARMPAVDTVGIDTFCRDGAAQEVDVDIAVTKMIGVDAEGEGIIVGTQVRAFRRDGGVLHGDVDVAVALVQAVDAVRSGARRRDGRPAQDIDVDIAVSGMPAEDAVVGVSRVFRLDLEIPDVDVQEADAFLPDIQPGGGRTFCRDGPAQDVDEDVASYYPAHGFLLQPGVDTVGLVARRRKVDVLGVHVDIAAGLIQIAIDAVGTPARRFDDGAVNVDIDVAVAITAESPDGVAVTICRVDAAEFYVDDNVPGVFALMIDIDADAAVALRGDVGVMHGHLYVAGGSTAAPGRDAMGCSVGVPQRRDGGVAHVNVDSPCASMVFGEDAVGGIACRLNRCQRNVDPDVAGRLRRGIWVGRHRGPVAKIGKDATGVFTRRRDMQVLATDFDVPAAYMTAIHAVGVIFRRVDVVAYETASFSGPVSMSMKMRPAPS